METDTTLVDTNQVSKQVFGYDDSLPYNNQNDVKEYDFGNGTPGSIIRETQTTFITSTDYTNAGLLSLPSQVSVYDGNGFDSATRFSSPCMTLKSNSATWRIRPGLTLICESISAA